MSNRRAVNTSERDYLRLLLMATVSPITAESMATNANNSSNVT
nr:MAG TPA: hypothetical protein [Caudoviricetes sp.]